MFCAGEATRLVSGGQVVAGRKLSFINDLAVTQDGKKVYFTDSSSRWQRRNYLNLIMEATADGRYDRESVLHQVDQKVARPLFRSGYIILFCRAEILFDIVCHSLPRLFIYLNIFYWCQASVIGSTLPANVSQ